MYLKHFYETKFLFNIKNQIGGAVDVSQEREDWVDEVQGPISKEKGIKYEFLSILNRMCKD